MDWINDDDCCGSQIFLGVTIILICIRVFTLRVTSSKEKWKFFLYGDKWEIRGAKITDILN
jgi:hypothetical protein